MRNQEKERQYKFLRLCIELTKQGFKFTRQKSENNVLIFDKISAKRLLRNESKIPFANSLVRIAGDRKVDCYFLPISGR
jgi:hypothetical protein